MSNMIFRALLAGIPWGSIVRTLELHERTRGVGDGKVEDHRYTIIQREDEIMIVLPDYQPREQCVEAAKKILSKLAPKSVIKIVTMGQASTHCNYCLQSVLLPYRCHRCGGWYCNGHRLPENHNCPGDKDTLEKATEQITITKKEKTKREIVVTQAPCG